MSLHKRVSLNLNIRGLGQSATLAINELSKQLENEGRTVYRMGLGQSPFPVPQPVVETLKNHAHEKDYLNVQGLKALREAVAGFHQREDNVDVKASHVLIGPGSKELMFLLQLVYYGELILTAPSWVSYAPQAQIIGRKIKYIHTSFENGWRITAEQLDRVLHEEHDLYKPRLLLLNYPANPFGGTYSPDELEMIAKVAQKRRMIILSDEIYGQLHYEGKHVSIAQFYPEGTIISSGLSKWCGAGGWRVGTFAFPEDFDWLMDPMVAVASETYTSVNAPVQYAGVTAFNGGPLIESYLSHVRRILFYLAERSVEMLKEAGIRVHFPAGAFYLFIDFTEHADKLRAKGVVDSVTLCNKLLEETGVAILPGASFLRNPEELTARLAFVNFDGAKALAVSETVPINEEVPEDIFLKPCRPVLDAMQQIVNWVK